MAHDLTSDAEYESSGRPTSVRYVVIFVTFLTSIVLYADRFCLVYVQQFVREDLGLSKQQFGWCLSAFFLSYSLGQVPSGWLSDRYGPRLMLALYVAIWSGFTAMLGLAGGFVMLFVARFAMGLGQAGAYPTAASVVARWMPLQRRGFASGLIALGGRIGGATVPMIAAALVLFFVGNEATVTLEQRDLLDARFLADQLQLAESADMNSLEMTDDARARLTVARNVHDVVAAADASLLAPLADDYRAALDRLSAAEEDSESGGRETVPPDRDFGEDRAEVQYTDPTIAAEQAETLVGALNQVVNGPPLAEPEQLKLLPLDRSAQDMADQVQLNSRSQALLNRLVIEAVFPDAIRKVYGGGWRPAMFVFGAAGLLVAAMYFVCVRDRPSDHPLSNPAEARLIAGPGQTVHSTATQPPVGAVPLLAIVKSPSLWLLSISQFGTNIGWVFLVSWLPAYLWEVHRLPFVERNMMASIPLYVGWAGMFLGGWVTDALATRLGVRWGRALPLSATRFIAMAAFILVLFDPSPWMATALFALVAFGTDLGSPATWAFNQDVGGRYIASVLGWGNMWGNLGATVSPILLVTIVDDYYGGDWNAAFITCAIAFMISGFCSMLVDATKPIDVVPESGSVETPPAT